MQQNNCGASPLIKGISTVSKMTLGISHPDTHKQSSSLYIYIYIDVPRGEEILESNVFKNEREKGMRPKSSRMHYYK